MNYNDKNIKNLENDDMNIKSHLNASLDLSGISVSEDLINRTLEAIKKQTAGQQVNEEGIAGSEDVTKKVIPWSRYVRGFAGVAAAALIIVAGYSMFSNIGGNKSSKEDTVSDTQMYGIDAAESAQEFSTNAAPRATGSDNTSKAKGEEGSVGLTSADIADESAETTDEAKLATQFTIVAGSDVALDGGGTTGSAGIAVEGEDLAQTERSSSMQNITFLNFRDIFLSDPSLAQSITITDEITSNYITLTNQEEILDFYSVMDKHQFTYNADAASEKNYTVEIASLQQNEALYTMTIGNNIIVSYSDKDVASQSIYSAADSALLLQELQVFYNKYFK